MLDDLPSVHLTSHPLLKHKLTFMRDRQCYPLGFSTLLRECGMLLGYEATLHLPLGSAHVETPFGVIEDAPILSGSPPVIVPILRAGLVMAEGFRAVLPVSDTGHIGLKRDPENHNAPIEYYVNLPPYQGQTFFLIDPVVATGHTMIKAASILVTTGIPTENICAVALLGAASGIHAFASAYPGINLFLAACDAGLNANNFVIPGVGDVGDRLFGTV
jgi:uracil phosphoribosyltransferase